MKTPANMNFSPGTWHVLLTLAEIKIALETVGLEDDRFLLGPSLLAGAMFISFRGGSKSMNLAKLQYFTNLDFSEIAGDFPKPQLPKLGAQVGS